MHSLTCHNPRLGFQNLPLKNPMKVKTKKVRGTCLSRGTFISDESAFKQLYNVPGSNLVRDPPELRLGYLATER